MNVRNGLGTASVLILLAAHVCAGATAIAYESLNSAGAAWSSNGTIRLGGTLGQMGWTCVGTGGVTVLESGFWKLEDACELYPVEVQRMETVTNAFAITFGVMRSNRYTVVHLPIEGMGLLAGTHAWTNPAAGPFTTDGGMGSTTTLVIDVGSATNAGRFFVIRCEAP